MNNFGGFGSGQNQSNSIFSGASQSPFGATSSGGGLFANVPITQIGAMANRGGAGAQRGAGPAYRGGFPHQPQRGRGAPQQPRGGGPHQLNIIRGGGRGQATRGTPARDGRGMQQQTNQPQSAQFPQQNQAMMPPTQLRGGRGRGFQGAGHQSQQQQQQNPQRGGRGNRGGFSGQSQFGQQQQQQPRAQSYQKPQSQSIFSQQNVSMQSMGSQSQLSDTDMINNSVDSGKNYQRRQNQQEKMSQSQQSFNSQQNRAGSVTPQASAIPRNKSQPPVSQVRNAQQPITQTRPVPAALVNKQSLSLSRQSSLTNKPLSAKPAPLQQKPQPSVASKREDEYDDQQEYGEEDYYDDEEYGEEDQSLPLDDKEQPPNKLTAQKPAEAETGTAPKKNVGELIKLIKMFKGSDPAAANMCEFFLSNSCTFGATCKNQHDVKVKKMFDQMTEPYFKQLESQAQSETQPPEVKKVDLRSMVLSKPSTASRQSESQDEFVMPPRDNKKAAAEEFKDSPPQKQTFGGAKKTLQPAKTLRPAIVAPDEPSERPKMMQSLPPRVQAAPLQPILKRAPSTTSRTSALIKQKNVQFIQEFTQMKQQASQIVILGKAECIGMCPDNEIFQRGEVENSSIDGFEMDPNSDKFVNLAIKKYSRSAADKVMSDPQMIRPPVVLYKTVEYLRECIADLDRISDGGKAPYKKASPSFGDVYSFVRDRFKSITQDFGILDRQDNQYQILALEEISRFLIVSTHDGFTENHFDMKQNMDIINSNLTALKMSYDLIRIKYPNPNDSYRQVCLKNEAEFLSYWILLFPNDPITTAGIINTLNVPTMFPDKKAQSLIREAIKISASIQNNHTSEYFRYLRNTNNYMFACFLLKFLNDMRRSMLNQLTISSVRDQQRVEQLKVSELQRHLMFDSPEEVESFAEACGFISFVGENTITGSNRIRGREQDESFKKWQQKSPLIFLDNLRGTRSRCLLMQTSIAGTASVEREVLIPQPKPISTSFKLPTVSADSLKPSLIQVISAFQQQPALPKTDLFTPDKVIVEQPKPAKQVPVVIPSPLTPSPADIEKEQKEAKAKEMEEAKVLQEKQKKEAEQKEILRQKQIKEDEERKRVEKEKSLLLEKEIQWLYAKDKLTKWGESLKNRQALELCEQILSYKTFLKKKRVNREYSTSLEDQKLDDFLEESIELVKLPSLVMRVSSTYDNLRLRERIPHYYCTDADMKEFSLVTLANKVIENQTGILRVKLFSHKANKENSAPQDVYECLVNEIFNKTIAKPDLRISYQFKALEFPSSSEDKESSQSKAQAQKARTEDLMHSFMGANLLVIYSSLKSLLGDIKKAKEAFALCPEHSGFTVLWILHKSGDKLNIGEANITESLQEALRLQKISSLHITNVYSNSPAPKLPSVSKRTKLSTSQVGNQLGKVSIKNAVLAFTLPDIETALKSVQVYPSTKVKGALKMATISQALEGHMNDLLAVVNYSQDKELASAVRKLINNEKYYFKDPQVFEAKLLSNEILVTNFLIKLTQSLVQPIQKDIQASIKQIIQQMAFSDFNLQSIKSLSEELVKFAKFQELPCLTCPADFVSNDGRLLVKQNLERKLATIYDDKSIQSIVKLLPQLYVYDGKTQESLSANQIMIRGAQLFSFVVRPYLTSLTTDVILFESHHDDFDVLSILPSLTKAQTEMTRKETALKKILEQRQVKSEPITADNKRTQKKHRKLSESEKLVEEVKVAQNPQRYENKHKEMVGKKLLQMRRAAADYDESERERLHKVQEESDAIVKESTTVDIDEMKDFISKSVQATTNRRRQRKLL